MRLLELSLLMIKAIKLPPRWSWIREGHHPTSHTPHQALPFLEAFIFHDLPVRVSAQKQDPWSPGSERVSFSPRGGSSYPILPDSETLQTNEVQHPSLASDYRKTRCADSEGELAITRQGARGDGEGCCHLTSLTHPRGLSHAPDRAS